MLRHMRRVLITGMSGTGKSSVIRQLAARGYKAVDLDYPWPYWHEEVAGEWLWHEERVSALLAAEDADVLFVSGTARNQTKFYSRFNCIALLTAPLDLMLDRIASRDDNPYGKRTEERERIATHKVEIEPLLRRVAHVELDTTVSVDEVVRRLIELCS